MTTVSRRDFFKRIPEEVADFFVLPEPIQALLQARPRAVDWQPIGRLADLVPGTCMQKSAGGIQLTLSSSGVGIRATTNEGTTIALRAAPGGALEANPGLPWPATRVLSHLSCEPVDGIDETDELNEPGESHER